LKGAPGRGTLEKEKPPILGMIQRGGQVVLKMLANVQQTRIKLIIEAGVAKGALIHTDECDIYAQLHASASRSLLARAGDDAHASRADGLNAHRSLGKRRAPRDRQDGPNGCPPASTPKPARLVREPIQTSYA